jgi:hypothetical protein
MTEVSRLANRPEVDLLLCCARTELDSQRVDRMRTLLNSVIDWPTLLRMAVAHGVLPLLYFNLKKTCPDLVPQPILDQLHNHFLANAGRNLFLTEELLKLLHLFEANEIPAVPLKGPALAASIYGDLALRMFDDLDIVVHKRDVKKAKALALSQGYRLGLSLNREQEIAFLQSDLEGWFVRNDGRVMVEIQWGEPKDFPFTLDFEPFWRRLEKASLAGRTVSTFSSDDLLIILSMHGAIHCWQRLNWICDLAELIRGHEGWDWKGVIDEAERRGWRRILFLGLFLVHDLLEAVVPEQIWQKVRADSSISALAGQVCKNLFHENMGSRGPWENNLFYLKLTERFQDRISYCLRLSFHPTIVDWEAFPLPPSLFFLYHLIHPIRVAGKYGWRFLGRFFVKAISS